MKMILPTLFAIVITTLLVGCASGPSYDKATIYYDRQTFVEASMHDVPSIVGPIVQHGRCVLFLATPGATMAPQSFCVYALAKDALYILKWNANNAKYKRLTTVFFKDIEYVALSTFGRTKQVQMTERTRLIAFGALIDDGGIYDGNAGAKVFDIVKTAGVSVGKTSSIVYAPMAPVPFIPVFIK